MEFHFDFVVNVSAEQASSLLASIADQVEEMDAFLGGGFTEYTWVDLVSDKVSIFLLSWRNRINRFLGRNPWHAGQVAIGSAVYASPNGERHEG